MNILIYLLWIDIMTQMPSNGHSIILNEYSRVEQKRSSFSFNENNTPIQQPPLTELINLPRILQKKLEDNMTMFPTRAPADISKILEKQVQEDTTTTIKQGTPEGTTLVTDDYQKTEKVNVSKVLIEGPPELIPSFSLEELEEALNMLEDINIVPQNHVIAVWNMARNSKEHSNLTIEDLKKLGDFVQSVPNDHLFYLNLTNWDLVEYLGKIRKLERHDIGILSASLLRTHGFEILRNHSIINRMYGILCGFDSDLLKTIPDQEFRQIKGEIFDYLNFCSTPQKRELLKKATKPTTYGPPQAWTEETVEKAHMLILAMKPQELISIRPPAMRGLKVKIIDIMSTELILAINSQQLAYLTIEAYLAYKKRISLNSRQIYHKPNFSCNVLLFVVFLLYLEQNR